MMCRRDTGREGERGGEGRTKHHVLLIVRTRTPKPTERLLHEGTAARGALGAHHDVCVFVDGWVGFSRVACLRGRRRGTKRTGFDTVDSLTHALITHRSGRRGARRGGTRRRGRPARRGRGTRRRAWLLFCEGVCCGCVWGGGSVSSSVLKPWAWSDDVCCGGVG